WKFYVQHYDDPIRQRSDVLNYVDKKLVDGAAREGIFYPRAGTLGGCTAHHAMICIYPHHSDWNYIADITGDESWRPEQMREHFLRLEHCTYFKRLFDIFNRARHGFRGWLTTSTADPLLILRDKKLAALVAGAFNKSYDDNVGSPDEFGKRIL